MKRFIRSVFISFLFLFCRFATSEELLKARSFSLIIRGGYGLAAIGDLNTTLSSINSMYDGTRESNPDLCSGEIRKVPSQSPDGEVELQWTVGRFTIGIAAAIPTHYDRSSSLTYVLVGDYGTQTNSYTFKPEIRASAPIKLNLYYSHPLAPELNLLFHGGLGYYRARMIYDRQWNILTVTGATFVGESLSNVSGHSLGFHIGAGLEYRLNHRFSLLFDTEWRLAKIRSLKGNMLITSHVYDAEGNLLSSGSSSGEGSLYHLIEEDSYTGVRSEQLYVFEAPPDIGIGFPSDIRKAFLDLSGFTFKIGLKIGLF